MNKRASLSLSITAIVVIVIAFVVLGLGLGLTQKIFTQGESELIKAFDITELKAEPTSSNPITVPGTINIDHKKSKTINIGFYNKGQSTAIASKFVITECLQENEFKTPLPFIDSMNTDVSASEGKGFSVIFYEKGLPAGTYICTLSVCKEGLCDVDGNIFDQKQFFLKVVA